MCLLTALVAAAAALVQRFRRAAGVERQQLKWVAFAATVAGVLLPVVWLLWGITPAVAGVLAAAALSAFPIAAGIAVLRYRLYDLDQVVNRALVYASMTALLGAAYALTVLVVGVRVGRDSVAVATATLVVAVAFAPVRAKLQVLVDRRFSRAQWEARARVSAFLEDVRAGRSAPEEIEQVLREVLDDRSLEVLIWLPSSKEYVDVAGRSTGNSRRTDPASGLRQTGARWPSSSMPTPGPRQPNWRAMS